MLKYFRTNRMLRREVFEVCGELSHCREQLDASRMVAISLQKEANELRDKLHRQTQALHKAQAGRIAAEAEWVDSMKNEEALRAKVAELEARLEPFQRPRDPVTGRFSGRSEP